MRSVIRKAAAALACLLVLSAATALAETPAGLENFPVRYGDRESRKIAITMDDANEREYVWKAAELCEQYGITMTFFPVGVNLQADPGRHRIYAGDVPAVAGPDARVPL